MSQDDVEAELARLRAENEALKARSSAGNATCASATRAGCPSTGWGGSR